MLRSSHGGDIVSILLQVSPESDVLVLEKKVSATTGHRGSRTHVDSVLLDIRDKDQGYEATEKTQRARHEEWVLAHLDLAIAPSSDDVWENISANESTDLADGSGDGVILATNRAGARLCCHEPNVVSWP